MKMPEPQERTRTQVSIGLSFAFDCSEVGASFLIVQSHFLRDIQHQGFFLRRSLWCCKKTCGITLKVKH